MIRPVVFARRAAAQIEALHHYIEIRSGRARADSFIEGVVDYCSSLKIFPLRGTARDDIRPGLRISSYRRRVVIAFSVEAEAIVILSIYYRGRDYETDLRDRADDLADS